MQLATNSSFRRATVGQCEAKEDDDPGGAKSTVGNDTKKAREDTAKGINQPAPRAPKASAPSVTTTTTTLTPPPPVPPPAQSTKKTAKGGPSDAKKESDSVSIAVSGWPARPDYYCFHHHHHRHPCLRLQKHSSTCSGTFDSCGSQTVH